MDANWVISSPDPLKRVLWGSARTKAAYDKLHKGGMVRNDRFGKQPDWRRHRDGTTLVVSCRIKPGPNQHFGALDAVVTVRNADLSAFGFAGETKVRIGQHLGNDLRVVFLDSHIEWRKSIRMAFFVDVDVTMSQQQVGDLKMTVLACKPKRRFTSHSRHVIDIDVMASQQLLHNFDVAFHARNY